MHLLFCFFLSTVSTFVVAADTYLQQRQLYLQAQDALRQGHVKNYNKIRPRLNNYPLETYLDYSYLTRNLNKISLNKATQFVQQAQSVPLANRFERRYLNYLKKNKNWQAFLAFYPQEPHSRDLKCAHFLAKWHTGARQDALSGARQIWLSGQSQPKSCDPLFMLLMQQGLLSNDLVWQRLELAFQQREYRLMRYLVTLLDKKWQSFGKKLLSIYKDPSRLEKTPDFRENNDQTRAVIVLGLGHLARQDPSQSWSLFERYKSLQHFTQSEKLHIRKYIAHHLMSKRVTEHRPWLDRFVRQAKIPYLVEKRVRLAIWEKRWSEVLTWYSDLEPSEKKKAAWRYWRARSLEATQQKTPAKSIYRELAKERNYYGFWSAHRLGKDYNLSFSPTSTELSWEVAYQKWSELARVVELKKLKEEHLARGEWYALLNKVDPYTRVQLGALALERHWHNFAIQASIQASAWDALDVRFPVPMIKTFNKFANMRQLDLSLLYAISRQESAWNHQALSPAGARGLMQLMPRTAKSTAKNIGFSYQSVRQLHDPQVNVRLGSAHLKRLLRHYGGNRILASAAYNAGMGRVSTWLDTDKEMDSDVWVENIPFQETRQYVKNILAFSLIYQYKLNEPLQFLSDDEMQLALSQ